MDADNMNFESSVKLRRPSKESGSWKGYDAKRLFKREWLQLYKWLASDPDDPTRALCKRCNTKLRAHKGDIVKHEKTKRHSKKKTVSDIIAALIPSTADEGSSENEGAVACNQTESSEMNSFIAEKVCNLANGNQHIVYLGESNPNANSQQTLNVIIDKWVEQYHQRRFKHMEEEHEATESLSKKELETLRKQLEIKTKLNDVKTTLLKEQHEVQLEILKAEHVAKLKAINDVRDAKLQGIGQELFFLRQEHEEKMKLIDVQLTSMTELSIQSSPKQEQGSVQLAVPQLNQTTIPPYLLENFYQE